MTKIMVKVCWPKKENADAVAFYIVAHVFLSEMFIRNAKLVS